METTLESDLRLSVQLSRAVHQDALADHAHRAFWRELVHLNGVIRTARAMRDAKGLQRAAGEIWEELSLYALSAVQPRSDAAAEARVAIVALALDLWMQAGNWTAAEGTAIDGVSAAFREWRGSPPPAVSRGSAYEPEPEEVE